VAATQVLSGTVPPGGTVITAPYQITQPGSGIAVDVRGNWTKIVPLGLQVMIANSIDSAVTWSQWTNILDLASAVPFNLDTKLTSAVSPNATHVRFSVLNRDESTPVTATVSVTG